MISERKMKQRDEKVFFHRGEMTQKMVQNGSTVLKDEEAVFFWGFFFVSLSNKSERRCLLIYFLVDHVEI